MSESIFSKNRPKWGKGVCHMSRALLCVEPGKLEWKEYREEPLASGQVRVKAEFSAAKHGTEMAFFKGYFAAHGVWDPADRIALFDKKANPFPVEVGNMFAGPVVEVGPGVKDLKEGDVVYSHGGFRETHTLPAGNCRKLPAGVDWRSAVCLDPAHFALAAIRDGNIRKGDVVAVFGIGAIGLVIIQLLKGLASKIIAIDLLPGRRKTALALGADCVIDPKTCDAGMEIRKLTGMLGADVCVEFSGSRPGLQQALRGAAYGGTVVCGAFPAPYDAGLDLGSEAHMNVPNVVFSRACSEPNREYPRWTFGRIDRTCKELIEAGAIDGRLIVDKVVPFDELINEYPKIATDPQAALKLGARHA
jgi:threonine dehydrogenase-like Zn-dependent dehydrogenase